MPSPKDPQKLQEYKDKMSRIAKERGYGKWMTGKKASEETLAKMSLSQKAIITDAERERRSATAKKLGYGKWMLGRKLSEETCQKLSLKRKGKTYGEIYGEERAVIESEKRRSGNLGKVKNYSSQESKERLKSSLIRTGKTYSEIYGAEQAIIESEKRSLGHLKRWEGKERKGCRDKKNGETLYKNWRFSVFERDSYTCKNCGKTTIELHAHHIKSWAGYPEFRYDVNNGITLCIFCHSDKHPENSALKRMATKYAE